MIASEFKFVALYKCYRGGEWFRTSLDSIKDAVDAVVAVFGPSWIPTALPENCMAPLQAFAADNPKTPVHIVQVGSNKQDVQYAAGMDFIERMFPRNVRTAAMIVDTDEIWMGDDAAALRQLVAKTPLAAYFSVAMRTYVRSPCYEIFPGETNAPTVAVNCRLPYDVGTRFSRGRRATGTVRLPHRFMHHYSFVRGNQADIELKFFATESQEPAKSNAKWLGTTWNQLPNVTNFHMAVGHERCWPGVRVLRECDIPEVVHSLPFIQSILAEERTRIACSTTCKA